MKLGTKEIPALRLGADAVLKAYLGGSQVWPLGFDPASLFAQGEQGVWYDPSDLSTMFQDSAGTVPVTAVEQPVGLMLDKSGRDNHASQPTATSRPVLSARVNQYLATETIATQNVTTLAAQYRLNFEGSGTVTLSGTTTGVYSAGSHLITCTAGTLTSTVSGSVTKADLRVANTGVNLPPYQRVNTATDYDTVGFPHYLRFDGVDDWLVTPTITPGTDKAQVFAGVRKLALGAQAQVIVELGSNSFGTNGISVFSGGVVSTQTNEYSTLGFASAGYGRDYAVAAMPSTDVLTALFDVANPVPTSSQMLRANGASAAGTQVAGTNMGAGNFLQNQAYIGRRGGTSRPFNGHLYGLIVRFGSNLPAATIENTENYINQKTRAY